jgi:GNAT superfamily N-acetyltransferase
MVEYQIRPITLADADIVEMAELLRTVFPDAEHFTTDVVTWQYRAAPDGTVVGMNAWAGAVLAAHYATVPITAKVNGKEERGLLSLNTATHPAHQGRGLFTKLAKATYALGAEQGFGFVVGVANANSTHGFINKLGFQLVAPLRAMIGVGPLPASGNSDVAFERLWSPAASAWRLAHPTYDYTCRTSERRVTLFSERTQYGARYVLGVQPWHEAPAGCAPLTSAPLAQVWIGLDPGMNFSGRPYLNVPMRFRPSPLNLIFKDLTGEGRTLDAAKTRFQAMDFDIL